MFSESERVPTMNAMNLRRRALLLTLLIFTLANPVLAAPADQNFAKWEAEISAFERSDATNPPPRHAILFVGSSTIRLWRTLAQDFPHHRVINRGFGGSHIVDATHFADRIIFPYEPRAIFFRSGGNDLAAGKSSAQVFADFKAFVTTVHAKLPATDIYYIAWSPTLLRWANREHEADLNRRVKDFAATQPHLKYIDAADFVLGKDGQPRAELLRADKLHFNEAGYKLLTEIVRPHLPADPAAVPTQP